MSSPDEGPEPTIGRTEQAARLTEQLAALRQYGVETKLTPIDADRSEPSNKDLLADYDPATNQLTVSEAAVVADERMGYGDFAAAQRNAYAEIGGYLLVGPDDREQHPQHPREACPIPAAIEANNAEWGNGTYAHMVKTYATLEMRRSHGDRFADAIAAAENKRATGMRGFDMAWSCNDNAVWDDVRETIQDMERSAVRMVKDSRAAEREDENRPVEQPEEARKGGRAKVRIGTQAYEPAEAPAPATGASRCSTTNEREERDANAAAAAR